MKIQLGILCFIVFKLYFISVPSYAQSQNTIQEPNDKTEDLVKDGKCEKALEMSKQVWEIEENIDTIKEKPLILKIKL